MCRRSWSPTPKEPHRRLAQNSQKLERNNQQGQVELRSDPIPSQEMRQQISDKMYEPRWCLGSVQTFLL